MVLGWFLIRPYPYPDHVARKAIGNDDTSSIPDETTQLISNDDHTKRPSISGLALMRTVDFWLLSCIMSLCGYFLYPVRRL